MTSHILFVQLEWGEGGGAGFVDLSFPTFVPEFKNDKIPNSLCLIGEGVYLLSNFCS